MDQRRDGRIVGKLTGTAQRGCDVWWQKLLGVTTIAPWERGRLYRTPRKQGATLPSAHRRLRLL